MIVYTADNVNGLFRQAIGWAALQPREDSRNGPVRVFPQPVTSVYRCPTQRVLFSAHRDANPFFHLFESIWMLAGRWDAAYLNQFVKDFGDRYAETEATVAGKIWGAYGMRWRSWFNKTDQLDVVVDRLRLDPNDRRVVIQMWDADADLSPAGRSGPRDVPCNTQAYPRVRRTADGSLVLDLTVTCRSNDVIWGAYGANAVHFSVLQEYLAARIGVAVGTYYQVSNNMHVYEEPLLKLSKKTPDHVDYYTVEGSTAIAIPMFEGYTPEYEDDFALFTDNNLSPEEYTNPWFKNVALPMRAAHSLYREQGPEEALQHLIKNMVPCDWRLAAIQWLQRRAASRTSGTTATT